MSFFERAKAAASDLAAKADVAMSNAGIAVPGVGSDRALRDLGVVAWLDATGRPVSDADRERVMATLRELESSGRLGSLSLTPVQPYGTPRRRRVRSRGRGRHRGRVRAAAAAAPPPPPPPPGGVAPAGDSTGPAAPRRVPRPAAGPSRAPGRAAGVSSATASAAQLGLRRAPARPPGPP